LVLGGSLHWIFHQLTRLAHAQGFAAVAARHATLQAELAQMIEALRCDR